MPTALLAGTITDGTPATRVRPATVLVAVHSPKVREALVAMIAALDGYSVVGEARTDEEAVTMARALHPVLCIVDLDLPVCGGIWAVEALTTQALANAVITIGMRGDPRIGARAKRAGARAHLQTGSSTVDLVLTLEEALVHCGGHDQNCSFGLSD